MACALLASVWQCADLASDQKVYMFQSLISCAEAARDIALRVPVYRSDKPAPSGWLRMSGDAWRFHVGLQPPPGSNRMGHQHATLSP